MNPRTHRPATKKRASLQADATRTPPARAIARSPRQPGGADADLPVGALLSKMSLKQIVAVLAFLGAAAGGVYAIARLSPTEAGGIDPPKPPDVAVNVNNVAIAEKDGATRAASGVVPADAVPPVPSKPPSTNCTMPSLT